MMLQLYGNPRSRAMRCLWMLEEMGKPYQLIEKSTRADDLQSAEYLRLNPNARIPTLVDGDLVLWESMAINIYLAQKYEGPMHCYDRELKIAKKAGLDIAPAMRQAEVICLRFVNPPGRFSNYDLYQLRDDGTWPWDAPGSPPVDTVTSSGNEPKPTK
jgi:glutathione S-transferase